MTFSPFSFEQISIPRKTLRAISVPFFAAVALLPFFSEQRPRSFLITNARVADGTGAPLYKANERVAFSHVVGIGSRPSTPTASSSPPASSIFTITPKTAC